MRGFLQGSLWGLVLGISVLGVISLVSEQPDYAAGPPTPQIVAPELDVAPATPTVTLQATNDEAPALTAAAPLAATQDAAEPAPEVATEPAELPEATEVAAAIETPETTPEPALSGTEDELAAPRAETTLIAPTSNGDAPEVGTASAAALSVAPPDEEDAPAGNISAENARSGLAEGVTADAPAAPEIPAAEAGQETASTVVETADVVVDDPAEEAAPAPPAEEVTAQENDDQVTIAEALPQTNTAVRINRPGATPEDPDTADTDTPVADVIPDDAPALLRYAAAYDDSGAPARISIVLIDDGSLPDPVNAVSTLGFVPTVAMDALASASTERAAAYRAAGIEVAMQTRLPEGARPTDVEVAFEVARRSVPEVAMLFSDGTDAMQDRGVMAQVMEILAADGYGFVTVQRGLGNAVRTADQAGVPAATILRDIDGEGEDLRAIARALDQAAFRARQTGEAVLLGRVRPDTLEALRDWAAGTDQDTLAIVPVSAVLLPAG